LAALFTQGLLGAMGRARRAGRVLKVGAGLIMVAMGLAMMTGTMSWFAF